MFMPETEGNGLHKGTTVFTFKPQAEFNSLQDFQFNTKEMSTKQLGITGLTVQAAGRG